MNVKVGAIWHVILPCYHHMRSPLFLQRNKRNSLFVLSQRERALHSLRAHLLRLHFRFAINSVSVASAIFRIQQVKLRLPGGAWPTGRNQMRSGLAWRYMCVLEESQQ